MAVTIENGMSITQRRQQLEDDAEVEREGQERNELLRDSHPAFAQDLRFPNDGGEHSPPSPRERAEATHRGGDEGIFGAGGGFGSRNAGRGSGEGEDASLQKAEALRLCREKMEARAARLLERSHDVIVKSDLPEATKRDHLDEHRRVRRDHEYARAAAASPIGHANAMALRAQYAGAI